MQKFYAVKNLNDYVRSNSSSGGVFYELATHIIEKKGVVYGAAFDDNHSVNHIRVDNKKDLEKFYGSKYTESNIGNCYEQVKKDLVDGKFVLFSGTPCQVNAVKVCTKKIDTSKLFLVDIVCHGVPEKEFYMEYLNYMEKKYHSKIKEINMRYKDINEFNKNNKKNHISIKAVEPHVMMILFENGFKYCKASDFDVFYQLFDLFIRKSCFKCPFASLKRCSDVTIGDFHEFSSSLGSFNDGNGVSLVITNTDKGDLMLSLLKSKFNIINKNALECLQPAICKPATKPETYEAFRNDYNFNGFSYVVDKYRNKGIKYLLKRIIYKLNLYNLVMKFKNKLGCGKNDFKNK